MPSAFSVQEKRCGGEKRGGIEGEKAEKSWAEQGRGGRKKKFEKNKNSTCQIKKYVLLFISCQREILLLRYAAVAQLDRVFGYEPKGRGFESLQPYHSSQASYRLRRVFLFHCSVFQCSGQVNCPSVKVFAAGENTCTAHQRRWPKGRLGDKK